MYQMKGYFLASVTFSVIYFVGIVSKIRLKEINDYKEVFCESKLFVSIEASRPSQQFFSHGGTEPTLPGFNQYCRELMCLVQGHNTVPPLGGSNPGPLDCKAFYINRFMCRIVHNMLFCTYCVCSNGQKCLDNLDGPNDKWMTKIMDVVRMGIGTWDILKCRFEKQNIPSFLEFKTQPFKRIKPS